MSGPSATSTPAPAATRHEAWRSLLKLQPYLRRYRRGFLAGLSSLILMGVLGMLPPLYIGILIDSLSGRGAPITLFSPASDSLTRSLAPFYRPLDAHTVLLCCILLATVIAMKGIFNFASRWILTGISRDIEYDLREDLLAHLLTLDAEFYVRNRTGELMSRATNDLSSVRMLLGEGVMFSATTLVTSLLAIYPMVCLSGTLTLWVLMPVPVIVLVVRYFGRRIHVLFERIQAMLAVLSARVQENLSGVRVIRAYAQEPAEIAAFDEPNRQYVTRNMELITTWALFVPVLQALVGGMLLLVLWQGGRLVMLDQMSLGALVAFHAYSAQLIWPMVALGWVTNIFEGGAASMGRLNHILASTPRIRAGLSGRLESSERDSDGPGRRTQSIDTGASRPIHGQIEFRHLSFAYPSQIHDESHGSRDDSLVLKEIYLSMSPGTVTAIVGPTGSGKSTLVALIAGLWQAPPGALLVDGCPIEHWPLAELRAAIGYVPQDTFLFSETLRANISLGVPDARLDRVVEVAEVAGLAGDVADFPQQYETLVGERGITLSGGQKQRTALARALTRGPKILILDDAFSSVDSETEERILSGLESVMRRCTTLLISHRISTVRRADRIVVLDRGRVIEQGTHSELLGIHGHYADLYRKQLLEKELERS
jgi:ATP-binding cassette subfamily B multidrug efflux pump